MFDGYKTYVFSALVFVVSIMFAFGWISQSVFISLIGIFGSGAGVSLRAAIKKIEK